MEQELISRIEELEKQVRDLNSWKEDIDFENELERKAREESQKHFQEYITRRSAEMEQQRKETEALKTKFI